MSITTRNADASLDQLTELLEELLDAHCDTVCLADDFDLDGPWAAHREYLKGLQRVGQRTLAELQR